MSSTNPVFATLSSLLKEKAQEQVKHFPQYNGYFDKWILVKVNRKVKTKLGLAFDEDEISIARLGNCLPGDFVGMDYTSVWSFKTHITTSVPSKDITIIR